MYLMLLNNFLHFSTISQKWCPHVHVTVCKPPNHLSGSSVHNLTLKGPAESQMGTATIFTDKLTNIVFIIAWITLNQETVRVDTSAARQYECTSVPQTNIARKVNLPDLLLGITLQRLQD